VTGGVPPDAVAVKETELPVVVEFALPEIDAERAGLTSMEPLAEVAETPFESVTVTWTEEKTPEALGMHVSEAVLALEQPVGSPDQVYRYPPEPADALVTNVTACPTSAKTACGPAPKGVDAVGSL
jgi:hypothetical protein